jgi:hypothetical protein
VERKFKEGKVPVLLKDQCCEADVAGTMQPKMPVNVMELTKSGNLRGPRCERRS